MVRLSRLASAGSLKTLFAQSWYNNLRQNNYPEADGLEITRSGYRELLPQFLSRPNTLLVLDPPYVSTQQGAYAVEHYFGMVDFLRLMGMVRPPFVFFSSTRSEFPRLPTLSAASPGRGWSISARKGR